jgi:hypothetical protein
MAQRIHAYYIFYNEATRAALDPAFEPLDNSANERPDWYEYWPIGRFFESHPDLDDSAHYGFFSPHFHEKTQLSGRDVMDFAREAGDADVITFSPFPCHGAVFANVLEHGSQVFPGFLDVATAFLRELDPGFHPGMIVNDSRDTVFCNFFLATPKFWRVWLRVFSLAFEMAETGQSALADSLRQPISYQGKPTEMKVMLLERIPSFLLASGAFSVRNYPPFAMPLSSDFPGRLDEVKALDALKVRFRDSGDPLVIREFYARRDALIKAAAATAKH